MSEQATAEAPPEVEVPPVRDNVARLYEYSAWVHIGPGADGCEDVNEDEGRVDCSNPTHFHAWCRLPNQLQHRELREKGLAAKARRTRLLRDPESDAFAILEEELDQLARLGDEAKASIVDEILAKTWWRDYQEAVADVRETEGEADEDGEPGKLYEHIEDDQQRFLELSEMAPEDRSEDEYESLRRHLTTYNDLVDERARAIAQPARTTLEALDINALVDKVRDDRIESSSMETFLHTYNIREWALCTLRSKVRPERLFPSVEALEQAAPEVIAEIGRVFTDLEADNNQGTPGKAS
jgi:hypothetical protein